MIHLQTLVIVLLLFSATIFVHELGHFLTARRLGMVVEVFSIGFGPAIWKRKRNGILYKIGCIPFGGYVALPQMDPSLSAENTAEKTSDAPLPPAAPWKKTLVAIAGAGGNALFAFLLSVVVFWVGKPSAPHERIAAIGYVEPDSRAAQWGLRPGDVIERAAGRPVENWLELSTRLTLENLEEVALEVRSPDGTMRSVTLPTEKNDLGVRTPAGLGMVNICRVRRALPGMSAEAAGVVAGDVILAFGGQTVYSREHLRQLTDFYRDRETILTVRRDGAPLDLTVRPAYDEKENRALIGIEFDLIGGVDFDRFVYPRPGAQMRSHAGGIFRFLRSLVTPKQARAAAGAVGGPISILFMYWQIVRMSFRMALWFTAFLNVNLAILNLLPLPVLDGGHILFSVLEALARGPLRRSIVLATHRVFAALLIALFLFLAYRDTLRWIWPRRLSQAAEAAPSPEPSTPPQP